jgi:uncharacterized protein with von Willebrand factor type A (vWA) domain
MSNNTIFDAMGLEDEETVAEPESHGGSHRASVANVFGLKDRPVEKTPHAIEQFDFDRDIYEDILNQSLNMQDSVAEGSKQIKTFEHLSQDAFLSLYKHQPRLKNHEEVEDMSHFNRDLMEELMNTEEYQKLRMHTRHDILSSAIGTEVLQEEAVVRIKRIRQEMNQQAAQDQTGQTMSGDQFFDLLNQMHDAQQQMNQAQSQQNALAGMGDPGGSGQPQKGSGQMGGKGNGPAMTPEQAQALAQAAQQQAQQAQQQMQQAQQQLQQANQSGQNPMQQMHQAMQQAANTANDQVTEVQDFIQAWGMEGGDKNRRITYEDKKRALQRLRGSKKLKKLTDLIGRFRALATDDIKRKSNDGSSTVKSVTTGHELQNVLPSELMQLGHKTTKTNFKRKYAEKQLLTYDKESMRTKGRGPVITCCDTSGSMDGKPEEWSKALCLALLEIAQKQKRAYAYIAFDHQVRDVYEIPYGTLKPDVVFDIAEKFSSGGTNFEGPLRRALDIMKKQKFKKGDIIFVTDGSAHLSPEFLKEFNRVKKEKEFTVRTVLINIGGYSSGGIVQQFSDDVITLSSLSNLNEESAKGIFAAVDAGGEES